METGTVERSESQYHFGLLQTQAVTVISLEIWGCGFYNEFKGY